MTKLNLHNKPFLDNRVSKKNARISVLLLDSIVNINNKYYQLVFLNKRKYIVSKKRIKIMIAADEKLIIDYSNDEEYYKFNKTKVVS